MAARVGKYRLQDPQRLFFTVVALAILIALLVRCSRGGSPIRNLQATDEDNITTYTTTPEEVETGTVRMVGTSSLESLPGQISVYMASMLMTNLTNVNNGLAEQLSSLMTAESDFNPDKYRYIVAINPAHGGSDKGNVVDDLVEKNITLDVARMMVDYMNLNNNGFYFYLTRGSDITMTDQQRLSLIQSYSTNLVVSIHVNATDIEAGGTLGTYWDDSLNATEDSDEEESTSSIDKARTNQSKELAQKLMDAASEGLGMWSRWIEVEEKDPLLKQEIPACNVYLGYLTYPLDYSLLENEEGRQQAAQNMGKVLLEYIETIAPAKSPMEVQIEQMNGGQSPNSSTTNDSSSSGN